MTNHSYCFTDNINDAVDYETCSDMNVYVFIILLNLHLYNVTDSVIKFFLPD
jgi:hypothetical protein